MLLNTLAVGHMCFTRQKRLDTLSRYSIKRTWSDQGIYI